MQGLAVIAPIAATLGTMPSIPPARWFVSLAHPAALIVSGLAIYAGSRLGARAIAGKLGTPPAATAGATEFVRGALVAVGAYVTLWPWWASSAPPCGASFIPPIRSHGN